MNEEGFSPPQKKNIMKLELWMKGLATHPKKKALWNLSREWSV